MALDKEALWALIGLQRQDSALDAIQKEIESVPPRIAALKADLESEKRRMDAAKAKIVELEKKKRIKELDVASKDESARKHQGQLNELKSNEAYKAMQAEIDKEKAVAGDIETEILLLMEEIDKARVEEKAAVLAYKKTEDFAKKDTEKLEAVLSEAKGRHGAAKTVRDEAAPAVPADMMKVYEHIRGRGKRDAIVPAEQGHCSACQISLAPNVMIELTKLKSLITCESCNRILFKPEPAAAATGASAKP